MQDIIWAVFKAEQEQRAPSSVSCMGGTSSEKGSGSLHNKEQLISTEEASEVTVNDVDSNSPLQNYGKI